MLPETTDAADRTRAFAWYSALQDVGVAVGALCSALPALLRDRAGFAEVPALRASMGVDLALVVAGVVPYLFLSRATASPPARERHETSPRTRGILARICGLFAIDSVAGGFLTASFLALFFRRRFGVDEGVVAALFFGRSVLNAASHFGAAWIAKRI